jgi:HAD superfamily hydrolase (TIGR01490 family)
MRLALFDFDGTISNRDSFLLFLRFSAGPLAYYRGLAILSPRIILFLLKKYSNKHLKEDFITTFLAGREECQVQEKAQLFCHECLPGIIREAARQQLLWHKEEGDHVVVVSASLDIILAPWCRRNGYDLLASRLETKGPVISGKLSGENCRDKEKVERIRAVYDLNKYSEVWAYGDSSGDIPMLDLADQSFYRPFT